jgi:hypothetical protein
VNADLHDTAVFADELQTVGDPRGELLSLELAAYQATESDEARRLQREAQRIRDAHDTLVWPPALRNTEVAMRSGFVVSGEYERLFAPRVPSELAVSARSLWISRTPFEDFLPELFDARERGLALDHLARSHLHKGPIDVAELARLATRDGRWPAVCELELPGALQNIDGLTALEGLRSCRFDHHQLSPAELSIVANLALESLSIDASRVGPTSIAGQLCQSLTRLRLYGIVRSPELLRGLSRLESLALSEQPAVDLDDILAPLDGLTRLELVELTSLRGVEALAALPGLRHLTVGMLAAELVPQIGQLNELESLSCTQVVGGPLELGSLAGLTKLRRLKLPSTPISGELLLPPSCEALWVSETREALRIIGEPAEVFAFYCDPGVLPPALLAKVKHLGLWSFDSIPEQLLRGIPQSCPELEHLEIKYIGVDEWEWAEAPAIVTALPRLRSLTLDDHKPTQATLRERCRVLPEIDGMRDNHWPRNYWSRGRGT